MVIMLNLTSLNGPQSCIMNDLQNITRGPTCFKGLQPSMIELCIVSKPRRFGKSLNYNCSLSDWHNLIAVPTKIQISRRQPKEIVYRSYKHFEEEKFIYDIECIPFHVIEVFNDNDDRYWAHNNILLNVVNTHAPIKKWIITQPNAPQMNSQLRKAMYSKRMFQNKII